MLRPRLLRLRRIKALRPGPQQRPRPGSHCPRSEHRVLVSDHESTVTQAGTDRREPEPWIATVPRPVWPWLWLWRCPGQSDCQWDSGSVTHSQDFRVTGNLGDWNHDVRPAGSWCSHWQDTRKSGLARESSAWVRAIVTQSCQLEPLNISSRFLWPAQPARRRARPARNGVT